MNPLCWRVRAKCDGVKAMDTNGDDVEMPTGMTGWMEQSESLAAALRGDIEILSPDGVTAYQLATENKVKPNAVQAKTEAPTPAVAPPLEVAVAEPAEPSLAATPEPEPAPVVARAPKPTPSAAPAPPRVGPQFKAPKA